jgi:CspA family cold shock protein
MPQGKVKWFDMKKGYGFIRPSDESQKDVFAHLLDVQKSGLQSLVQGQDVEYQTYVSPIKQHEGKQHAKEIKIIKAKESGDEA